MPEPSRGIMRRTFGGIRFRITIVAALAVLVVLVVTSVGLVRLQERSLVQSLDEGLEQGAGNVEEAIAAGGLPDAVVGFGDDDTTIQVVDGDGRVLAATANTEGRPAPEGPAPLGGQRIATTGDHPYDEGDFRVLTRVVATSDGPLLLYVSAPTDDIAESIDTLTASLTLAVPFVVVVLATLIWILVGRTLRPVEDIRAEVSTINASDLSRRVPEPATNDEIARLAHTMNAMLERVEGAVDRQRRFVADASHELRTPLTRMRSELEVDLAHPGDADAVATHRSVLEEATALEHLIDDLLLLARSDAAAAPMRLDQLIDLDDLVHRCADSLDGDRLSVDATDLRPVQVRGNRSQLARAVGNVVDNAARYAESVITLRLSEADGEAVLTIVDDGPGIPPSDAERVFERFTRLDDSRTATTGGAGLGLAIARDIVTRHGGSISIDPGDGARVTIRLPLVS
jgi:signal transduction histidine kinase